MSDYNFTDLSVRIQQTSLSKHIRTLITVDPELSYSLCQHW